MTDVIEIEPTPNPDAMRFSLPPALRQQLTLHYDAEHGLAKSTPRPAARLLEIDGVASCMFAPDFVTVSRIGPNAEWSALRAEVALALIESAYAGESIEADQTDRGDEVGDDAVTAQIRDILHTQVAPRVAQDGGHIALDSYHDGEVRVRFEGACGGCPSASLTLRRTVETLIKRYVPEVHRVVLVSADEDASGESGWKRFLKARGMRFRD